MNRYVLNGTIELNGVTVSNPEFVRDFVGFNQRTSEAQVNVMFYFTANDQPNEVVRTWWRTFNPALLPLALETASEQAMLNLPEITGRYTLIEE